MAFNGNLDSPIAAEHTRHSKDLAALSYLAETWSAEAYSPMGPWEDAIKIVMHDKYTFYKPPLHPEFVSVDSLVLLFEITNTATFPMLQC